MARDGSRPSAGRRVAAVTAIGSLVIAILAVTAGVTSHLAFVLASAACLAALGLAGWYAVSRAGGIRLLSMAIAVCLLISLVFLFLAADINWLRVVGAFAAVAVSVAAANYALRPSTPTGAALAHLSASRRPVLLMNPKSGGGKVERFHLVDECRKRGIEPVVLRPGDDLLLLAEDAIASGADVIGMAGGDGSQALIASVASAHGSPMVVIPAGTRNHFAMDLGLDRDNVVGALDAFGDDGVERKIDLATVNGRIFVNNASLGIYARIVQSPGYRDAKAQTAASMLPTLLGPDASPFDLRFMGPDGTEYPSAHLVMVSNNPYQLQTLAGFGTRDRLDLGVLGIMTARIANAADWEAFLALEAVGQVRRFHGWMEWQAPRFEIRSAEAVEIGVDGEAMKMDPPLVFTSEPSRLRVRVPSSALETARAHRKVRLLARSTVADLGRVAAGHAGGQEAKLETGASR